MKVPHELKVRYGVLRMNNTATITMTDFNYENRTCVVNIQRPLRNASYRTRSYTVKEGSGTEKRLMKILTKPNHQSKDLSYEWPQ